MKIWQLVCGSVLVLSMTSCGNQPATTPPGEPATTGSAPTTEPAPATSGATPSSPAPAADKPPVTEAPPATSTATGSGFPALKAVISETKKAGEADNFDVATTEFSKFEEVWKTVGDKVKTKMPADHKAIEASVETANMAIASKNKKDLLASLTKLSGSVDKVSK